MTESWLQYKSDFDSMSDEQMKTMHEYKQAAA